MHIRHCYRYHRSSKYSCPLNVSRVFDCSIPSSYLKTTASNLDKVNLSPLLLGKTAAKISVKSPAREFKKSLYNQVLLLVYSENCTFFFSVFHILNYLILAFLILIGTTMKLTPCHLNP